MPRLLHIGFFVIAGLLVARVAVEFVGADERRDVANAEIREFFQGESNVDSTNVDAGMTGMEDVDTQNPESISKSLNCSVVKRFAVAKPASSGFICASENRVARPLTVFVYEPGGALEALDWRKGRACKRARDAGQPAVHVLITDTVFIYTTSSQAVESSTVAQMFMTLDSRTCD